MIRIYNDFVSALVLAAIVTFLVYISLPPTESTNPKHASKNASTIWKAFLLSLIICYAVLYFLNDIPSTNNVMEHMIQGEPDF